MMTKYPELFAALSAPFPKGQVKTRPQAGRQLSYVTARTVMNRLDMVLGPENWWDEYSPMENSVLCRLSIRMPEGTILTKSDAGGYAGMADSGDDDKSGYSDAFKRAAVKFGIARELYQDGTAHFDVTGDVDSPAQEPTSHHEAPRTPSAATGNVPSTGRALFAWTKEIEQKHDIDMLKYLNGWGKLQNLPFRMVEWTEDHVSRAYVEACRKLDTLSASASTKEIRPFVEFIESAAKYAGVAVHVLVDDVMRSLIEEGKVADGMRDLSEKTHILSDGYKQDYAHVSSLITHTAKTLRTTPQAA